MTCIFIFFLRKNHQNESNVSNTQPLPLQIPQNVLKLVQCTKLLSTTGSAVHILLRRCEWVFSEWSGRFHVTDSGTEWGVEAQQELCCYIIRQKWSRTRSAKIIMIVMTGASLQDEFRALTSACGLNHPAGRSHQPAQWQSFIFHCPTHRSMLSSIQGRVSSVSDGEASLES